MNYHAAAERLCITQPAVTQHIRAQEQHFGVRLFQWDGRRLMLSRQGGAAAGPCGGGAPAGTSSAGGNAYGGEHPPAGGASKTIGEFVLAPQLTRWLADPARAVSLQVDNTAEVLARLDRGELDFALIEGSFDKGRYAHRLYRQERFAGVCGREHLLAGKTVEVAQLWPEHLLLREEGSGTRHILEQQLEAHGYAPAAFARVTELGSFGLMARMLAGNGCITFAYAAVAAGNPARSTFQVAGWEISRAFSYVWLPDSGAEEAIAAFDACR